MMDNGLCMGFAVLGTFIQCNNMDKCVGFSAKFVDQTYKLAKLQCEKIVNYN